ncbi:hypothetical protein VNO77_41663 [Canavalia gladiata]|uniref:Uncharacterized protein n=1 Tax=Canavalia gladiata TaxID=3824 RepID=A0AAN9K111_CANGL
MKLTNKNATYLAVLRKDNKFHTIATSTKFWNRRIERAPKHKVKKLLQRRKKIPGKGGSRKYSRTKTTTMVERKQCGRREITTMVEQRQCGRREMTSVELSLGVRISDFLSCSVCGLDFGGEFLLQLLAILWNCKASGRFASLLNPASLRVPSLAPPTFVLKIDISNSVTLGYGLSSLLNEVTSPFCTPRKYSQGKSLRPCCLSSQSSLSSWQLFERLVDKLIWRLADRELISMVGHSSGRSVTIRSLGSLQLFRAATDCYWEVIGCLHCEASLLVFRKVHSYESDTILGPKQKSREIKSSVLGDKILSDPIPLDYRATLDYRVISSKPLLHLWLAYKMNNHKLAIASCFHDLSSPQPILSQQGP